MKAKRLFIYVSIILFFFPNTAFGQNDSTINKNDTVFIKAGEYLYINNKLTFFTEDTILIKSDSLSISYRNGNQNKSKDFYNKLGDKAKKKRFTDELYDLFVKDYGNGQKTKNENLNIDRFIRYEGKEVNSIRLKRLDVFGPSLSDTSRIASTWISEKANNFHIITLPSIIRNNLLIEKNDQVNSFTLSDNERILRNLPYIKDARFIVTMNPIDTNKVDLLIITQDVWSIGIEGNLTGINSGYLEIFDKNIFGTGHEFSNTLEYDSETLPLYGYEGYYKIPNIKGTFINTQLFYKHNRNKEQYGFNIQRNFISPEIKYGGGIHIAQELWYEDYITDTNLNITPQNHIIEDYWIGRSIKLSEDISKSTRKNLFITARLLNNAYQYKEVDVFDSTLEYIDNTLIMMTMGISKTRFYRGRFISGFGKTEDIPTGAKLGLTSGFHYDEIGARLCLGADFSFATYSPKNGYLYTKIEAETFRYAKDFEQALVKFQLKYFTKLFNIFNYQSRQFLKINYVAGYNRRPYEELTINNRNGIRLFSKDDLTGDRKLVVSLENVLFTPINFYGFRFALFGFADFAVIGDRNKFIFDNEIYSGIGAGVRIRNDNLVFKTLELKFIIFPILPDNHNSTFIHVGNETSFSFQNFNITAPHVSKYE